MTTPPRKVLRTRAPGSTIIREIVPVDTVEALERLGPVVFLSEGEENLYFVKDDVTYYFKYETEERRTAFFASPSISISHFRASGLRSTPRTRDPR